MNNLVSYNQLPVPTNFTSYINFVSNIPSMEKEEEISCIKNWQKNNDKESAKKLVLSNLYIVIKLVNKHANYGLPKEDLAQEGTVGLIKAIKKFNVNYNVRLSTYAWYWVDAQIKEYIIKNFRLINLKASKITKKLFFGYRKTLFKINNVKFNKTYHKEEDQKNKIKRINDSYSGISIKEISEAMNISEKQAIFIHDYFSGKDINILNTENNNKSEKNHINDCLNENYFKCEDNLKNINSPENIYLEYEKNHKTKLLNYETNKILNSLPERNKDIIESRFLTNPPLTLSALAKKYNISIERVRQIEQETLNKIKRKLTD